MMEEEQLKILFRNFEPRLASDAQFMLRLQRNMACVEQVKQEIRVARQRHRISLMVAALSGVLMGGLFVLLCWPFLEEWMVTVNLSILNGTISLILNSYLAITLLAAVVSGCIAFHLYEIMIGIHNNNLFTHLIDTKQ